jgi:hypothetical protein
MLAAAQSRSGRQPDGVPQDGAAERLGESDLPMDSQSGVDGVRLREVRQFSVRELLILTLATSLVLAIGVSSRGSRYFGAFSSLWALASLAPISIILAVGRFRLMSRRALVVTSIGLFTVSLCMPALGLKVLSSMSVLWGWFAFFWSMSALPEALLALFAFWNYDAETFAELAYLMGDVANVAYVAGVILFFVGNKKPDALLWCRRASVVGAVLAAAVLVPLATSTDLMAIYPGHGAWVASFLALGFAARY